MLTRPGTALALLCASVISFWSAVDAQATVTEYSRHFGALSKLSVAVAEAMPLSNTPSAQNPGSMTFGELMAHIASTNYAFCAGLEDAETPTLPSPADKGKGAAVKFLSSSFEYCSSIIPNQTDEQLNKIHNSPDGRLPGREVLLAMFVHVAHHRGQAEIYLRDKGITPPSYRI